MSSFLACINTHIQNNTLSIVLHTVYIEAEIKSVFGYVLESKLLAVAQKG